MKTRNIMKAMKLDRNKLNEELVFTSSVCLDICEGGETDKAIGILQDHARFDQNKTPKVFHAYQGTSDDKPRYVIFSKTNTCLPGPIRKSQKCIVCNDMIMVHGPLGGYPDNAVSLICDTGKMLGGRLHSVHTQDHAPLVKKIWKYKVADFKKNSKSK